MRRFIASLLMVAIAGCASYNSTDQSGARAGLVYYLPKHDLKLSFLVKDGWVQDATIVSTAGYPDLSKRFYLSHSLALAAKTESDIEVDNGLLKKANGKVESQTLELFQNLAKAAATFKFRSDATQKNPAKNACLDGSYEEVYDFAQQPLIPPCGIGLIISKRGVPSDPPNSAFAYGGFSRAGVYYRQKNPYLIKLTVPTINGPVEKSALLFSATGSPEYFLPLSKSLFASNTAEFSFVEGVPTKYFQSTESEIVGLLKLPAEVFKAYFEAVGGIFTAFTQRNTNENTLMQSNIENKLNETKYNKCMQAAADGDEEKLLEFKCSEKS